MAIKKIAKELPKEVQIGLEEIAKLDEIEEKLEKRYRGVKESSPLMQLPPIAYDILDQEVNISMRKAEIWNNIRGYVVSNEKPRVYTLWQVAIDRGLPVHRFGKENMLDFGAKEIYKILSESTKEKG